MDALTQVWDEYRAGTLQLFDAAALTMQIFETKCNYWKQAAHR